MDLWKAAPETYQAMIAFDQAVHLDGTLKELIKLRSSMLNACAFCIDMHAKDARLAGETEQRIYGLAAWEEAPYYTDKERAALALTDAVTNIQEGHVPEAVWDEAHECFDDAELAQVVFAITAINSWNRLAITTRTLPGSYKPRATPRAQQQ